MLNAVLRILAVMAGLVLLSSLTGGLRADEKPAPPASQATKPESTEPRDENVLAEFEVAKDGDALILPVTIQGRSYPFLVDTGTTRNGFSTKLREVLGPLREQVPVRTFGSSTVVEMHESPECYVGPFPVHSSNTVMCVDLQEMAEAIGMEIRGVLGLDFLRQHRIEIDFDNGKLRFLKSVPSRYGTAVSMLHRNVSQPFVLAKGNPVPVIAMSVDTGYNGSVAIEKGLFKRLCNAGAMIRRQEIISQTATHKRKFATGLLSQLEFAEHKYQPQFVVESHHSYMGLAFLSRHHVVLDFPSQRMHLKPGRRFDEPDRTDLSGFQLIRRQGVTRIQGIYPDSPAANAGFLQDDVIRRVNNSPADTYTLFGLRRLFSGSSSEITLVIEREGAVMEKAFYLQDYRNLGDPVQ